MSDTLAGLLQIGSLLVVLALVWKPLGDYLAWVYSSAKHLRVERAVYKLVGVDADAEQSWPVYLRGLLAFSVVGILALYLLQRVQQWLPLAQGRAAVPSDIAFNTSVSFVTNTNWQSYAGESTMSHLTQMAGLAVQNFVSAAVGIAVAIAVIRGFVRVKTDRLGNFWVDLTRGVIRVLLPLSVIGALILVAAGTVQNLSSPEAAQTLGGVVQNLPGGPVASQEIIKELGTNGGGFFNANAAHPFENPNAFTNWFQLLLILSIPVALTRTFGKLVGDRRQGLAILATMSIFAIASIAAVWIFEAVSSGSATQLAGMALEGKETRFGIAASSNYAAITTLTSTGSVNSFHDSYTPLGGGVTIVNMLLGEIAPGGVGAGLYGILILAILAVFIAGLMVGRTPEYLKKKITGREIKLVALYILATPFAVLLGTALALAIPSARESILNAGPHGLSEVLYAYTSAGNNNGSAFGGLGVATPFYNTTLGLAMLVGRFLPICFALALAGSLAGQRAVPDSAGTLQTHKGLFVGLLVGVILIVTLLTYFPALALGALAEGL